MIDPSHNYPRIHDLYPWACQEQKPRNSHHPFGDNYNKSRSSCARLSTCRRARPPARDRAKIQAFQRNERIFDTTMPARKWKQKIVISSRSWQLDTCGQFVSRSWSQFSLQKHKSRARGKSCRGGAPELVIAREGMGHQSYKSACCSDWGFSTHRRSSCLPLASAEEIHT